MPEVRTYAYEAMFLVSQSAAADLANVVEHVNELLARAKAEVLALRKWDERRLAFEIKKQKRGLYLLAYFHAPAPSIAQLERDCNLSEKVLRALILRCDHLTLDEMRAADGREALHTEAKLRAQRPPEPAREPAREPVPAAPEVEEEDET